MATWLIICIVLFIIVMAVIVGNVLWAIRTSPKGHPRYRRYRRPVRRVTTVNDLEDRVESSHEIDH